MKTKIQKIVSPGGFTLIELLVVISIIGVLSAFIIGGLAAAKKNQYRTTAKAELKFIEAAIESYKNKYGSYPPGNQHTAAADHFLLSPLYYELSGVNYNKATDIYTTLDGATSIKGADYTVAYGVGGIANVSKGSGDDGVAAQNFLTGLKAKQINDNVSNNLIRTTMLVTSIGGPDDTYKPLGYAGLNPFRYVYPGTNNSSAYDLWVDLVIGGKTNRIHNWGAK